MKAAMKKISVIGKAWDALRADRLEMQSRMTERVECPECGRNVTFCEDDLGDVILMCQHMIIKLKKLPKPVDTSPLSWASTLGLRVEVYPFRKRRL